MNPIELTTCPNCNNKAPEKVTNCPQCNFAFYATEEEKSAFIAQQILNKGKDEESNRAVKLSRNILFTIGVLNLVSPILIFIASSRETISFNLSVVFGLIFIGLGFYAKKKPFQSIMAGFIFLLTLYLLDFLIDPSSIFQGILWKIIFLVGLTLGLAKVKKN